jgi:hypothetical protein
MNDFTSDNYDDPYITVNYYQTPNKKKDETEKDKSDSKQVFNPYKNGEKEKTVEGGKKKTLTKNNSENEEKMPEYVDLNKNAYEKQNRKSTGDSTETAHSDDEFDVDDYDLPLLEELGISPANIKHKLISVLTFHRIDKQILEDSDMAGPLLVFILFAFSLVLQTKTHFGYLYGLAIFGSLMIYLLMNLMSNVSEFNILLL